MLSPQPSKLTSEVPGQSRHPLPAIVRQGRARSRPLNVEAQELAGFGWLEIEGLRCEKPELEELT